MTNVINLSKIRQARANKILDEGKDSLFETLRARIFLTYMEVYRLGTEERDQKLDLHLSLLYKEYDPVMMKGKKPEDPIVVEFLIGLQESFEKEINRSYIY